MARRRTRELVHSAALGLAAERRLGTITMEGIAARAGVSKQTLYRSWSSTGAILFDALLARSTDAAGTVVVPDSGDLIRDLTALAEATIDELMDPTQGALLRAVTADLQSDDDLARAFRDRLLSPQMDAVAHRFRTAGTADPDDAAELFLGAILHRWLLRTRPFEPGWSAAHAARTVRAVRPS